MFISVAEEKRSFSLTLFLEGSRSTNLLGSLSRLNQTSKRFHSTTTHDSADAKLRVI